MCVWGEGVRWRRVVSDNSNGRPDTDEGSLVITGGLDMEGHPIREGGPVSNEKQACRGAPSPNGGSGGRVRRAAR